MNVFLILRQSHTYIFLIALIERFTLNAESARSKAEIKIKKIVPFIPSTEMIQRAAKQMNRTS